jgi:hypothetical protein
MISDALHMQFPELFTFFVSIIIIGGGMLTMMWFSRLYWASKLREWAGKEGFRVVSFRGAKFKEGPQAWRQRRSERLFRIAIQDQMNARRAGWIVFAGIWGFRAPRPEAKVLWDDFDD